MTIRPMGRADIADGLRLCRASNWNQIDSDWEFFLDYGSARVVERDGKVVGSVAWLPFGTDFAWLSMMLVEPAARGVGIGSLLMGRALDALTGLRIRLDATPLGEPLYRRFGFVEEYPVARINATGGSLSLRVRPMTETDLFEILERDRAVFGADRRSLLIDLHHRAPEFAWVGRRGAYCFGRPGYLFPQIGPVVAPDAASAREVVDHCLAMNPGITFVLDVPQREGGLDYPVARPFLRMSMGATQPFGEPEQVFAITGPEFG